MTHDDKMTVGQREPSDAGKDYGPRTRRVGLRARVEAGRSSGVQMPAAVSTGGSLLPLSGGRPVSGTGCGKAILLGEHSVVFGKSAIATALPDLQLTLTLHDADVQRIQSEPANWFQAWNVFTPAGQSSLHDAQRQLLTRCFAQAIEDAGCSVPLDQFSPEHLSVRMNFPLGAGLGGSAALCAAMVDLIDQIASAHPQFRPGVGPGSRLSRSARSDRAAAATNPQQQAQLAAGQVARARHEGFSAEVVQRVGRATRLDHFFHGTASGVDTATVVSRGLLECQGGAAFRPLANGQRFYLALVDSGTRSETSRMVALVRERRLKQPVYVDEKINRLGELAHLARFDLQDGRLTAIGHAMNEAQEHLADLGLSTPELDEIVRALRELGAIGAKLTGSGGGGFAISLFREYPDWVLTHLSRKGPVYVSEVPVSSLPDALNLL